MTFPLVSEGGDLITNWPLQPSFPLFFRNVLYQFGNVDDAVRSMTVQPGEPAVLRPEAGVQVVRVTSPDDKTVELKRGNRPDFVYMDTDKVGVYGVAAAATAQPDANKADNGGKRSFTVNLLDANESNIEPREEIRIGTERFSAGRDTPQPRELWKWILVLAVVLLMVEWYIYNKRVSL